jgi:competence protein ComEC
MKLSDIRKIAFSLIFAAIFLLGCDGLRPKEPSLEEIEVHFIDVGQGDCIFIKLINQTEILIDAGGKDKGQTVVDYLNKEKVDDIELLIATHPHADHIGGLIRVLETFQVEEIIDSGQDYHSATYKKYLALAKEEPNCKFTIAQQDQVKTFGKAKLKILFPPTPFLTNTHSDTNANSVVALLDYGKIEFLFTGDICKDAEKKLLERYRQEIDVEVLKVAHHGSKYSTSEEFVRTTDPMIAIIQVGKNNRYGHPHQETLEKFPNNPRKMFEMYRNDLHGTVVISTDGQSVMTTHDDPNR